MWCTKETTPSPPSSPKLQDILDDLSSEELREIGEEVTGSWAQYRSTLKAVGRVYPIGRDDYTREVTEASKIDEEDDDDDVVRLDDTTVTQSLRRSKLHILSKFNSTAASSLNHRRKECMIDWNVISSTSLWYIWLIPGWSKLLFCRQLKNHSITQSHRLLVFGFRCWCWVAQ